MSQSVTVGEFARLTHLSVKTLHHYHEIGLLPPAAIDPSSGYRRYETRQVDVALLIRRLRDLQLPLADVRAVIEAPDPAVREQVLRLHLERLEGELSRTREAVASLREMLTLPVARLAVEYRFVPAFRAYTIAAHVEREQIGSWCAEVFGVLGGIAGAQRFAATMGATYSDEFFTEDAGEVVAFLPVAPGQAPAPGVELRDLPAGHFAITVHTGPFVDFDRTYAALGTHVAEHCEVVPGPIRELYLAGPGDPVAPADWRTEICWPIRQPSLVTKG